MRNKLLALLLCLLILCPYTLTAAADSPQNTYTVAQVQSLRDGIVAYKAAACGAADVQGLIDTELCRTAGISAEFYIIALSQAGSYRLDAYARALLQYLNSNEIYSASSRLKYALTLIACGSQDRYIRDTADEAIGRQGLMSLVFGLHILNNGYDSTLYTAEGLINDILSYQLADGGWAVIGSAGDTDVTAMTLQALTPYYNAYSDVQAAIDRGLDRLSQLQQDSGGYVTIGVENCESACQVLVTLSGLGIDAQYDSRFIKNGHTVLDAVLSYRNADGSFSHSGGGFNETATMEALYSLTAYLRMCSGQGPLYILDNRNPDARPTDAPHTNNASGGGQSDPHSSRSGDSGAGQSAAHSASGSTGAASEGEIIYIDGDAYVYATDAEGETIRIKVKATEAATVSTQATESAAPTVQPTAHGSLQAADGIRASRPATADQVASGSGGYRPYVIAAILTAAGIAALILFLRKKRNPKHYIAIGILTAAAIALVLLTNIQSREGYRQAGDHEEGAITVTMSVRCDTILRDEKVNDYIPDDGIIMDTTTFHMDEDSTVYDVLLNASQNYALPIDNRGAQGAAYIAGINYLYEFAYGDLSGWMYRVNGVFPDVGCQGYHLSDGDSIEWLYTKNIGKDLQ